MRKSLFLTLVLSLCVADFGAFAATARNGRSGGTTSTTNATQQAVTPVSARAGARQKVVSAPAMTSSASAPVSARAGARQKVVSAPATSAKTSASGNVAARAATKKAALSMGTKVAAATENTIVSQECQNAYYGCMDTFCMLDNATGGRCQCSDRSAELDAVMDEIMRIDEQSARLAAEGVEQIQMGEYADQVNNRASSVESGITTPKDSSAKNSSSSASKTLDLASLMNNNFFDVEEDTVFEEESERTAIDDIAGKTGDALQKAVAKICTAQVPAECKSSLGVLQTAYMSKIKSDCVGYENALKQQRNVSQQKLLTAQKSVRDAALDEVRKQNRYETAGECAIAFAQCMQTTAECGADYTGCVTLAAAENVKNNSAGSKATQTTIKGIVSGADITLAASTMESLLAKKEICASVTKQCVNANKNDAVWNVFLRNAAPALKSAELIAEQNLRSNCLPTVAECFKTACKSQFGDNNDNYDMCLSNPDTYKSLCKVQLEPCLNATGGTYENPEESSLWNGLIAMLNSMKVDACTKEIKDCLLSEDRCGKDFSGCIGLDTYSIGRICPAAKLTACMDATKDVKDEEGGTIKTRYYENEEAIYEYVAKVAQGLALNIDNSFLTQCQNAANEAMITVCGDTESCENIALDLSSLEALMDVQACTLQKDVKTGTDKTFCLPDETQFTDDEIYSFDYSSMTADAKLERKSNKDGVTSYGVYAKLLNRPDISHILFTAETGNSDENASSVSGGKAKFRSEKMVSAVNDNSATIIANVFSEQSTDAAVNILQGALDRMIGQIEADPKVVYCKSGREVQGFKANEKFGKSGEQGGRFPQLTDKYSYIIAEALTNKLYEKDAELQEKFADRVDEMSNKITERVMAIAKKRGDKVEQAVDAQNEAVCMAKNIGGSPGGSRYYIVQAAYNSDANVCTVKSTLGVCRHWVHGTWVRRAHCEYGYDVQEKTDKINLPKFQ